MPQIAFAARLTEADWDETLRGWRCPALAVPGAVIDALFVDGNRTDSAKYEVLQDHAIIRWTPTDQPQRVTASVRLTKELTLGTETDRWKKLAIVLPVAATIASAAITAAATLGSHWLPVFVGTTSRADPSRPPAESRAGPPFIQATDNLSKSKALDVPLGQPARGDTQERRWFKFTIADSDSIEVRITMKNVYGRGGWWWTVQNSLNTEIASSPAPCQQQGCTIRFTSPQSETYYLLMTAFSNTATYELTVSD
jgi:hypothetical protein